MDKFKENNYKLEASEDQSNLGAHTFLSAFYRDYYDKNNMNLKLMLSSKRMSERVSKLMDTSKTITNEDIINAITFRKFLDDKHRILFIMKEIKASLFVCKIMFAQMDVYTPFAIPGETMIDAEEMMISQDFIPELIPAMSRCYVGESATPLEDCFTAYEFMMNRVLEGINYAVEIALPIRGKLRSIPTEPGVCRGHGGIQQEIAFPFVGYAKRPISILTHLHVPEIVMRFRNPDIRLWLLCCDIPHPRIGHKEQRSHRNRTSQNPSSIHRTDVVCHTVRYSPPPSWPWKSVFRSAFFWLEDSLTKGGCNARKSIQSITSDESNLPP